MLHFIKGTLAGKLPDGVIIESGGIGFEVNVPATSRMYMKAEGSEVVAYTFMRVTEDDISLYGFDEEEGLELFKKLITVTGVGAKAAIAILSAMPASEVRKAIAYEDADMLTRANGVGKKTAQRIVLELKDKIDAASGLPAMDVDSYGAEARDEKGEAIDALIALGYSRSEAAAALMNVKGTELSVEDYIKQALLNL